MLRILALVPVLCFVQACAREPACVTAPFFTAEQFARVRTGMTADEVRALLGCPVNRFGPVSGSGRVDWQYSFAADVARLPVRYREYVVQFDPGRRVLGTRVAETQLPWSDGLSDSVFAARKLKRTIGDLALIRADGSTSTLKAGDSRLHVILLDADRGGAPRAIGQGPEWFRDEAEALLRAGTVASIENVYIGGRPDAYVKLLSELSAPEAARCHPRAKPLIELTVRDLDSQLLLYRAGVLYSVTPLYSSNEDDSIEDQKWLIRKLGGGEVRQGTKP